MNEFETVYAVHNFNAENDDELTFQTGETVLVIQKDDGFDDGWWKGAITFQGQNIRGEVGLFPMNYITLKQQTNYKLTEPPTPSTSDLAIRKTTSCIDTKHFDDECSQSPSVRSLYSFTYPITSSNNGPLSALSYNSSCSNNTLRKLVVRTLFLPNLRSVPPEDWDIDQVEVWLNAMNFECIAMNFKAQEITGDILLELNMETLKELDIPTFGKRFKVHSAISALKEECRYQLLNPMSITSPNYSKGQLFHQRSKLPRSIRFSKPICKRQSNSYPSNLDIIEEHYKRSQNQYNNRKFDDDQDHFRSPRFSNSLQSFAINAPITPSSACDITKHQKERSQNQNRVSPGKKQDKDPIQQTQKRQTIVLPMSHHSSMDIYSNRHAESSSVTPDVEGWLHKQSCKYKKWNKRWFVLKGLNLFYFKSPKDVRMKGIINLRGYRIIPDENIQVGKYSFKAQHDEERTFYFYTDLDTSMKAWISSLMKATISRDFSIPVLSSNNISTVSLDIARRMRPRPPSVLMYIKDNHNNLSPQSYEVTYGDDFTQDFYISAVAALTNTTSEDQPNQDTGFNSNDQECGQEEADKIEEDGNELDDGVEFDKDPQNETDDACTNSDHDVDSPVCIPWTSAEYIQWINTICSNAEIHELQELREGGILIELLEELSGKRMQSFPSPSTARSESMSKLDNIIAIFEFMNNVDVPVDDQYTVEDIVSGKEEKILVMLKSILNWSIQANDTITFVY